MLFPLHKLSKMTPQGSKIALILNGSPLFNGDAGNQREVLESLLLRDVQMVLTIGRPAHHPPPAKIEIHDR
jgi:hypothetical protein